MTKTNIKCMTMAKEKKKKVKHVHKYYEIYRLLKELLKYKLLTPEERSKTPEKKLVYS